MPLSTEIKPASFLRDAVMAGVMLALALALQNLRLPNLVTGALVNAIFTVTLSVAGLRSALLLAGLTPVGAFLTGHLPPPLILLMPVIIPGNIVYVIITGMLRRRTLAGEAVCAAAAKALFIGVGGGLLARWTAMPHETQALLWGIVGIQFFTAVAGTLLGEVVVSRVTRENQPA
ncbi:MAG TPA: hypothetical protein PLU72_15770 [Candidatus Ozemobacteraceae bacterium]|nr:hypothetical protein [Candidatus Ozemobacteraceae bacterium]